MMQLSSFVLLNVALVVVLVPAYFLFLRALHLKRNRK
jgi:hypothetical protein